MITSTNNNIVIDNIDIILSDDLEIIQYIELNGIAFFEYCYRDINIYNKYKNIINDYHYQYLIGELFEDSTLKYIEYLHNNTYLWDKYINECQINYSCVMLLFNKVVNSNYNIYYKCDLYKKLINNNTEQIIADNILCSKRSTVIKNTFIGQLVDSIDKKEKWEQNINCIADCLIYIMKYNHITNIIIKWFSNVLNSGIDRKNIVDTIPSYLCDDTFMFNITAILYKILNTINIREKNKKEQTYIQVIEPDYVYDTNCNIIWYSNKNNKQKKYNLTTKIFFLLAHSVCTSYIPIIEYKEVLIKSEEYIRNMSGTVGMLSTKMQEAMFQQLDKIELLKKENNVLINNNTMYSWITDYFNNISNWISHYRPQKFNIDDILESLLNFIDNSYSKNMNIEQLNFELINNILLDVVGKKTITANPELRLKSCKIIYKIINHTKKNNLDNNTYKYVTNLIILHNDLKTYSRDYKDNILDRYDIYVTIDNIHILYKEKFNDCIDFSFNQIEEFEIKNFVNIICNDISYIYDGYESLDNSLNTGTISTNTLQYTTYTSYLKEDIRILHNMYIMLGNAMLSNRFKQVLSNKDVIILLSPINSFLNKLKDYNFKYPYKTTTLINKNLEEICNVYMKLYSTIFHNNTDSPKFIFSSHSNFNIKTLYGLYNNYKNISPDNFIKFIDKCQEIIKITDEKNDIEYPEEFLDALVGTIIDEPVWLPNTTEDVVLDKSTVMKCLVEKNKNPYTGDTLTLEEFEEYNNTKEIRERSTNFIKKFEEWKNQNL